MTGEPQQHYADDFAHTAPSEWRWVIFVSLSLIGLLALPYFLAIYTDAQNIDRHFMGFLMNPLDGGTYLSKIQLGREGEWRTFFRHTPEPMVGAYLDVMYTGLGQLGRFLGMSNTALFHTARLFTSFLMFLGLYQLGATIWRRQRARRNFFLMVTLGSGLGWLYVPFAGGAVDSPDLTIPEGFPLYSAIVNAHFPLALALMSLSVGVIILALRPGFNEDPMIANGGLTLLLSSLVLALIAPHALIPLAGALLLLILFDLAKQRRLDLRQLRWLMMIVLPAAPLAIYYLAEIRFNPVVALWNDQNLTLSPAPWVMFLGFGVPLLIALPSLWRAIRRFERDGDQFMLVWLALMLIIAYAPLSSQRRFIIGIMIPISYFAVRSLDDFWFRVIKKRRQWIGVFVLLMSTISYVLLFFLQVNAARSTELNVVYLDTDYVNAFRWIQRNEKRDNVVLTSEQVGLWLPSWTSQRVVYGHPFETVNAARNAADIRAWYTAAPDDPICSELIARFDVKYVLWGDLERAYAPEGGCLQSLEEVQRFGDVVLYRSA